jgi:hypothetical protein
MSFRDIGAILKKIDDANNSGSGNAIDNESNKSFREEIVNYLETDGFVDATQAEKLSHLYDI